MQNVKPILKHVTLKFTVQKEQFYAQFEIFFKTESINGFEILGEHSSKKFCPKKFSLRP